MAALIRAVFVLLCSAAALAYNQNPKLYVDVKCISMVDPLRHGFDVVLPNKMFDDYLDPHNLPMLYGSAIPLRRSSPSLRQIMYRDDIRDTDHVVSMRGLDERSWYYVCIEFENQHRHQRQGNTSASCELYRTLDRFGKKADSLVSDVKLNSIWDNGMEFAVIVDNVDFPLRLDVYFEQGSQAVQSYMVGFPKTQPDRTEKELRVVFQNLQPGFMYGRLCVSEYPLVDGYTAMGRLVQVHRTQCYLDNLQTKTLMPADQPARTLAQLRAYAGDKEMLASESCSATICKLTTALGLVVYMCRLL